MKDESVSSILSSHNMNIRFISFNEVVDRVIKFMILASAKTFELQNNSEILIKIEIYVRMIFKMHSKFKLITFYHINLCNIMLNVTL